MTNYPVRFEVLGREWGASGDLAYCANPDTRTQARIFVDSLGETWVDIRIVPKGQYFPTERWTAYRDERPYGEIIRDLISKGYSDVAHARYAHRVRQNLNATKDPSLL